MLKVTFGGVTVMLGAWSVIARGFAAHYEMRASAGESIFPQPAFGTAEAFDSSWPVGVDCMGDFRSDR